MSDSKYSFKEFKRSVAGCSESEIKQSILYDYLETDALLFHHYLEKLHFELFVQEQRQKLEALQAAEEN